MVKLAIEGGPSVFNGKTAGEYAPKWPSPHPETEQKLIDIFRSGKWGLRGEYEQKLETEFAAYQGVKHSVWMANGTTTLECALLALGIGPGDEVIVPGLTWIATATAPLYCGAKPVIVDIDPETLCIDPAKIEEAVTPRTKAIIPVHLFSAVADMKKILAIAEKHHLHVVEDCAHAHGARQNGKGAGSFGEIGSFSFQLSKLMTGGEGGCCTTDDDRLAERIFRLSHIGNSHWHPGTLAESDLLCRQYRFTEFQAAIIYDQLQHQPEAVAKRTANGNLMKKLLEDVPCVKTQKSSCPDDVRSYYFIILLLETERLKSGVDRAKIFEALAAEGVGFGTAWGCPLYKSLAWNIPDNKYVKHEMPVCEEVCYKRLMSWGHAMFLCEPWVIEKAVEALKKVMTHYAK